MIYDGERIYFRQIAKFIVTVLFYVSMYYAMNFGYYKAIRPGLIGMENHNLRSSQRVSKMYEQYDIMIEEEKDNNKNIKKSKVKNKKSDVMKIIEVLDVAFVIKPDKNGDIKLANLFDINKIVK